MRSCNKSLLFRIGYKRFSKKTNLFSTGYLIALQHHGVKITMVYLGTDSAVWAPENNPSLTCSRTHFSSQPTDLFSLRSTYTNSLENSSFPRCGGPSAMACPMVPVWWWWNWWNAKLFGWSPAVCTGWPFGKKAAALRPDSCRGWGEEKTTTAATRNLPKVHQTVSETLFCFGLVSGDTQQWLKMSPLTPRPVLKAKEMKMIPSPSLHFRNYWLIPKER